MSKKILIGSILTIVIIMLASLTSVASFQSTKSSNHISPLFGIRTKKAINDEIEISCNYIGEEKDSTIHLPTRNGKYALLKSIIRSDDLEFTRFINLVRTQTHNNEIINILYQLRNNPDLIFKDNTLPPEQTIGAWYPGCLIWFIGTIIIMIIFNIGCFSHDPPTISTISCPG